MAHLPPADLRLHTPAHQGRSLAPGVFPPGLVARDVRYLRRVDLGPFEARLAARYGTRRTLCLTQGATAACLSAMLAVARRHSSIWVLRNCHKSVINGLILAGLTPRFIAPAGAVITPGELRQRLAQAGPEAPGAILFTNPSFEGWGMDLGPCIQVCRNQGLEILVDESHGSHWPASDRLPTSALAEDVDLVLHSLHKYAGALVQTALMHLPLRSRWDAANLEQALDLLETTTLSNLLLLSAETAVERLFDTRTGARLARLADGLDQLRRRQGQGGELVFNAARPGVAVQDPLKCLLSSPRADGQGLAQAFMAAGVDHEFFDQRGVLFIFALLNRRRDLRRFEQACVQVRAALGAPRVSVPVGEAPWEPRMRLTPREAHLAPQQALPVEAAQGRVAAELIATCPPGWPLLIPGEEVGDWHRRWLGPGRLIRVVAE